MRDFIFIIGPSGVGKTTLSKGLFSHYNGAFAEMELVCSDYEQNYNQMKNRGDGLIDFELLKKGTEKIMNRPLLVNEFELDVAGKTPEQVLSEAIKLIDTAETVAEYDYEMPPKEWFYSWVFANGLR